MAATLDVFEEMKRFVDFGETDVDNLKALAPLAEEHGRAITDAFYDMLLRQPSTAAFLGDRVERLKQTHLEWMTQLFAGEYGEPYFQRRLQIGRVHTKIGLPMHYAEGIMHRVRVQMLRALQQEIDDPALLVDRYQSLLKILDLDMLIINLASNEELLDRLSAATGMRRALIVNLIRKAAK